MTTHRIELTAASRDRATMQYRGEVIGESREPLFAAARYMLAKGLASPEDRIETWRGETMCLAGPVGEAAKLTVAGDKFQPYRGSEAMKPPQSRLGAIFLLSGIGRPTKANANVRGSNAAFDQGARCDAGHVRAGARARRGVLGN